MRKIILFASTILALWACSNEIDLLGLEKLNKSEKPLQIITRVLTTKSAGFIPEFPTGATIGLHVTSGNVGNPYNDTVNYKNVKAVAYPGDRRITWQQTPVIRLNSQKATIYAYYPYQEGVNFDVRQIPVRIASTASETDDYMYGTHAIGQKAVNNSSPVVLLNMNHALSLVSFQLKRDPGQKGAFIVTSVQVGNKAGGSTLASEGNMDISTGKISVSATKNINASTRLSLRQPITLTDTYSNIVPLKVIPPVRTFGPGDVDVLFTINGGNYIFKIPSNTRWDKGVKYLYKLNFNGKSLYLEEMSAENWLPGDGTCDSEKIL